MSPLHIRNAPDPGLTRLCEALIEIGEPLPRCVPQLPDIPGVRAVAGRTGTCACRRIRHQASAICPSKGIDQRDIGPAVSQGSALLRPHAGLTTESKAQSHWAVVVCASIALDKPRISGGHAYDWGIELAASPPLLLITAGKQRCASRAGCIRRLGRSPNRNSVNIECAGHSASTRFSPHAGLTKASQEVPTIHCYGQCAGSASLGRACRRYCVIALAGGI